MARVRRQGGGVRHLPSGKWQARIDRSDGKRESIGTFESEQEAWESLRKGVAEVDRGVFRSSKPRPLFRDFADRELHLREVRPRTRKNYESLLRRHLNPFFGNRPLDQIAIGDVRVWWSMKGDHLVNRRNAYFLLRSTLEAAVQEGLLASSPCKIKDAGKDVAEKRPTWSLRDFRLVMSYLDPSLIPAIEMLFASHCRLGELLALTAADFEPETGIVHVTKQMTGPTKTGQHKHIRILQSGIDALTAYLADNPRIGAAPLFVNSRGDRLRPAALRNGWKRACDRSGATNFHLHDLRHLGLSLAAQSGASTRDVMARGGHASINAAMRYQHSTLERDVEVARQIDERIARLN